MTDGEHGTEDKNLVDVSDGKWIPRDRFDQERNRLNDQISHLNSEVEALKTPAQQLPSRQELENKVEMGEMTRAEADEVNEARLRQEVTSDLADVLATSRSEERNNAILQEYVDLVPELKDDASDINKRVADEYQALQALGHPHNTATQVAAVRSVLGAPEVLKRRIKGEKVLNTHEETGEGGDGGKEKSDWDRLPERNRKFYERALDRGAYRSQEECIEEAKSAGLI